MPMIGIGELRREQNQLEQAYHYVDQGLSLTKQWSSVNTLEGHVTLARIFEAQGRSEEAERELQTAQECAIEFDATEMDDLMVAYHQARIWIMRGKLDTTKDWLQAQEAQALTKQDDDLKADHFFIELLRLSTHIRLESASGQTEKALSLLKLHQEQAKEHGVRRSVIEGYILQALALDAQGNGQHALEAIKEALLLGKQDGFIRLFVDEGQPLAKLLYRAAEAGFSPDFAGQLLAAFPAGGHPDPSSSSNLIEPLSTRETEILTLIAKGLTNQEIANQLVISLRTVKWHTSNIYGKLGVKNRTEAAARGRELGILPTK
jgi:LuxR family maltose regulon positive regulatory protein